MLKLSIAHRVLDVTWRGRWVLRVTPKWVVRIHRDGTHASRRWR